MLVYNLPTHLPTHPPTYLPTYASFRLTYASLRATYGPFMLWNVLSPRECILIPSLLLGLNLTLMTH